MSVKIKALVWEDDSATYRYPDRMRADAYSIGGEYSITGSKESNRWNWFRDGNWPGGIRNPPMTEAEAKAAAQADFEKRVRGCLE